MSLNINPELYRGLSSSEKKVIDYIDANQHKVESFSITMIANKTFTSTATVSRAIKKVGFEGGITELRYNISSSKKTSDTPLTDEEKDLRHVNKILAKSYRECMQTIDNMVITDILKVIEFIKNSSRIIICSLGSSSLVAKEFHGQLLMLGYNPILIDDEVWMRRSHLIKESDVVFFITALNTRSVLYTTAMRAKRTGAKIVTCICSPESNLEEVSDITIVGHSEMVVDSSIMSNTSRLPLMIITRTIAEYLAIYEDTDFN